MAFWTEILAVAVVWLSSFALGQLGVAAEPPGRKVAPNPVVKTVSRSPRDQIAKPSASSATASSAAPRAD